MRSKPSLSCLVGCSSAACNALEVVQGRYPTANTMTGKRTRRSGLPKPPRRGLLRYAPARTRLLSALVTLCGRQQPAGTCRVLLMGACVPATSLNAKLVCNGPLTYMGPACAPAVGLNADVGLICCVACHAMPNLESMSKPVLPAPCVDEFHQSAAIKADGSHQAPAPCPAKAPDISIGSTQGLERTAFDDESEHKRELVAERNQEQSDRMREAYNQLKYTERDKMEDMREQVQPPCAARLGWS